MPSSPTRTWSCGTRSLALLFRAGPRCDSSDSGGSFSGFPRPSLRSLSIKPQSLLKLRIHCTSTLTVPLRPRRPLPDFLASGSPVSTGIVLVPEVPTIRLDSTPTPVSTTDVDKGVGPKLPVLSLVPILRPDQDRRHRRPMTTLYSPTVSEWWTTTGRRSGSSRWSSGSYSITFRPSTYVVIKETFLIKCCIFVVENIQPVFIQKFF